MGSCREAIKITESWDMAGGFDGPELNGPSHNTKLCVGMLGFCEAHYRWV